jgi:hypothetical protein
MPVGEDPCPHRARPWWRPSSWPCWPCLPAAGPGPAALGKDPPNRYQLLAVLDADGRDDAEFLLILTVVDATLGAGADLLRQHGATGDVMTFDGGVSTFLWSAAQGDLVTATSRDGALPHYLCVHRPQ